MAHKPDEKRKPTPEEPRRKGNETGENQQPEVPGRTPSQDADKERREATGPGGSKPENALRGTEASAEPGAVNSPYPGDDMNTDPKVAP